MKNLKTMLDKYYREFDFSERLKHDPISFPHRYKNPSDVEIAACISSSFAYGNVKLFMPIIKKILDPMGTAPWEFIMSFNPRNDARLFEGIEYRFQKGHDITAFVCILSEVCKYHGSLKKLFLDNYSSDDRNIGQGLSGIINFMRSVDVSAIYGRNEKTKGLLQLMPNPRDGSACKRGNLFMRWMVRDKDIDFGLWADSVPKNKLIIPLDTHIARISKCLGLTKRKSTDWKSAVEITESLKRLDPIDPLKYDFALCHKGISGECDAKGKGCERCSLRSVC